MNLASLFWKMLRPRVAITLALFALIGAASAKPEIALIKLLWGLVAVALTYVVATCLNDLADIEIDKINHRHSEGRPLARGLVRRRQIFELAIGASVASLAFGLLLGWYAGVVITCLLLVDVVYSLRPVRISHRPYMVGITLTFGYVVGPFLIGLLSQGGDLKDIDQLLLFGLSLIFWGRIILKDFRDRVGDSAVGKETLLSRLGKANLLYASQLAIVLGLSVLCVSSLTLAAKIAVVIVGGIGIMLINQINTVPEGDEEQKLIGVSARMGNGALSLIITDLLLVKYAEYSVLIIIMLGVIYVVNAYKLWSHRDRIKLGYKG